ncbi:MAG: ribosome maturation factor RimP [Firmicutes bacterium]|nr:ribosome maturation factor RimP [Bacillota bacterium]
MKKQQIEQLVSDWTEEIIANTDMELVDVEYVKEGKDWFLRVFLDKEGGIDVEDCREVSVKLSDLLDEADPIANSYYLEVSSPGLERPLKKEADFNKFVGSLVNIRAYQAIEGMKEFQGELLGLDSGIVKIRIKDKEWEIPYDKIAKARLAVEF